MNYLAATITTKITKATKILIIFFVNFVFFVVKNVANKARSIRIIFFIALMLGVAFDASAQRQRQPRPKAQPKAEPSIATPAQPEKPPEPPEPPPIDYLLEEWLMTEAGDVPFRVRLASILLVRWGTDSNPFDPDIEAKQKERIRRATICLQEADQILSNLAHAEKGA